MPKQETPEEFIGSDPEIEQFRAEVLETLNEPIFSTVVLSEKLSGRDLNVVRSVYGEEGKLLVHDGKKYFVGVTGMSQTSLGPNNYQDNISRRFKELKEADGIIEQTLKAQIIQISTYDGQNIKRPPLNTLRSSIGEIASNALNITRYSSTVLSYLMPSLKTFNIRTFDTSDEIKNHIFGYLKIKEG